VPFTEILPCPSLRPFIKGLYWYEADTDELFSDIVFPSGQMELIFNLGEGNWLTQKEDIFWQTPAIELWGQVTRPLSIKSTGLNRMLGIRFYSYSAAYFFREDMSQFTNEIVNGADVFGSSIQTLYSRLLHTDDLTTRIQLVENYMVNRLKVSEKTHGKLAFVKAIADSLQQNCTDRKIQSISAGHRISTRYLSQLFSQYTGIAPKLFCKINRFQQSLALVNNNDQKLTGVAYDAGYFDQSHFIREFKLFTGITPSAFAEQSLPINQLLVKN
jgi:AraC-like DNA-binding protein